MDETGWRLRGGQRALWGMFTERHAILQIAADRHEDHAKDLLADSTAIVTSDRWWAYNHLPIRRRQICWSHLQRDFKPTPKASAPRKSSARTACGSARSCSGPGRSTSTPATAAELKRRVRLLQRELKADPARARRQSTRATATAAAWRATC